jgi:hypothetical protein
VWNERRRLLWVINSRQTMSALPAAFFESSRRGLNWSRGNSLIPAPAFPLGLALYGAEGLRFGQVPFAHHAPAARADAAPFFDDGETAEQVGLHVEPIEAEHVAVRCGEDARRS